jgi:hypothetical protein
MMSKLAHWLRLDQAQNAEERRQRITLYSIGVPLTVANLAIFLAAGASGWQNTRIVEGISALISLGMLLLIWLGYVQWANILYPTIMWMILAMVSYFGDGIFDEGVLAFPVLIALAGLLLRRIGVIAFTLASIVAVTFLGVAHQMRWIERYADSFTFTRVIIEDILLVLLGVFIYFVINNLVSTITNLRQKEFSLAASNQELQAIRASLENQVAERTASIESARQEAEVARRTVETQMWQVTGQARLSETLRGEQTLETLSQNIIAFLCRYLDLPAGALFVRQGDILLFSGGYAYVPADPAEARFAVGEGLLGQAVIEKRTLVLDGLPASQMRIASGLADVIPQALALQPLRYNDEGIGLVECAALQAFSPEQLDFLALSAESIAIALYTAQTRLRFAELLAETQNQAEELQAQEEELRAVNEELLAHIESTRSMTDER